MSRWLCLIALFAVPATPQDDWFLVALRFDAKGTLYVADAKGGRVHAIETTDKAAKAAKVKIDDLGAALAKALNGNAGDVHVYALAVHPLSHAVYLSGSRVNGGPSTLFRVNAKGELDALPMKDLKMKTAALPKGCQPLDLVVGPTGLIVSSTVRDKNFLARLHVIALPLADAVGTADSELYHVSHEAWETQAPLNAMTTYEKDKKTYVLGSTMCTPVVRLDAADVVDKKKVKSSTIVELGMGNAAVTLAVYTKEKKPMLLVSSEEATYSIEGKVLDEAEKINEKAINRNKGEVDGVKVLDAWKQVSKFALLDEVSFVVIKRGAKMSLETVELP